MNWRQQRSTQGEVTALLWWFFIKSRQNKMLAVHISATHSCHWNHMNIKCVWADFLSGGGAATARCLRRHVNICTCDTTGCFSGHYSSVMCNEMDILGRICASNLVIFERILKHFQPRLWRPKPDISVEMSGSFQPCLWRQNRVFLTRCQDVCSSSLFRYFFRKCWNIYSLIWN